MPEREIDVELWREARDHARAAGRALEKAASLAEQGERRKARLQIAGAGAHWMDVGDRMGWHMVSE